MVPQFLGRSLTLRGSHDYHLNLFNIDDVHTESEYAIFDDIMGGFDGFKSYKAWLGCQAEFTIDDKYRQKRKIHWGKPSIWLSNESPFSSGNVDHDWLQRNCVIVHIEDEIATPLSNTGSPGLGTDQWPPSSQEN